MNYNEVSAKIKNINGTIERLNNQISVEKNRDKTGLKFSGYENYSTPTITKEQWKKAVIKFDAYHGYYGNSSCHDDMCEELSVAVLKALNCLKKEIVSKAIYILEKEKQELAKSAKEEAELILKEYNPELLEK